MKDKDEPVKVIETNARTNPSMEEDASTWPDFVAWVKSWFKKNKKKG